MPAQTEDVRIDWLHPLTIADLAKIDALDDELRAVVERYVRAYPPPARLHEITVRELDNEELVAKVVEAIEDDLNVWSAVRSGIERVRRGKR